MKHHLYKTLIQIVLVTCVVFGSTQAFSAPEKPQPVANVYFDNTSIAFELRGNYRRATVNVTGPRFFKATTYLEKGNPKINLKQFGELDDGLYRYQILVATDEVIKLRKNRENNGRADLGTLRNEITKTKSQSGIIRIKDGIIIPPKNEVEREK